AEIAAAAFDESADIERPWTDAWGQRHARMTGRPVAFHAMRGISAPASGFHTCRNLHVLQMLLGAVDRPGSWRYKPPFPPPCPPGVRPAGNPGELAAGKPMRGPPLGCPTAPADRLVEGDGSPARLDKAFSWE